MSRPENPFAGVLSEYWRSVYGARALLPREVLAAELGALCGRRGASREPVAEPIEAAEAASPPLVREDSLEAIAAELVDCRRCGLCQSRKNIVFGEGNPSAPLFFVGEGPGEQEDLSGRPFVGKAGQLLDRMIEAMGFSRADVYIGNVVKCRPPGNRQPLPDESAACEPFLFRQIRSVRPKVLVVLGGTALKAMVGQAEAKITRARGVFQEYRDGDLVIPLMPTFHPAYLLRNPESKKEVWQDLKRVMERLKG